LKTQYVVGFIFFDEQEKHWLNQSGISSENVINNYLEYRMKIARFRFPHLISIVANDHIKLK
jgi:hypothetical protein